MKAFDGISIVPSAAVRGVTRRRFLTTSAALAASAGFARTLFAIPVTAATRRMPAEAWLPDPPSDDTFRTLALAAIDAARAAGAEFADIRIGVQRRIDVGALPASPMAKLQVGYGIRARVAGTWSFQHGNILTPDAVAGAARSAVLGAQTYAKTNAALRVGITEAETSLASTPVVTGEWRGPMQIDPFTIPLDDFYRLFMPIADMTAPIQHNWGVRCGGVSWDAETRVFASTEGSLVAQHFMRGGLGLGGGSTLPENRMDVVSVDIPDLEPVSAGFETVLRPGWVDTLLGGIDEAIRIREIPARPFLDVGRFPVVFEGAAFAQLVGMTAFQALDADRAFGFEADASGGTFVAPPEEYLGAGPTFSPLLTVTADRALPSITAAQWDDDGVVPEPYSIIRNGEVVDYHTTRDTAPLLATWYQKQRMPVRSHGTAVAATPASLPVSASGHARVNPSAERAKVDDFIRDMSHGFIVRSGNMWPEPGLTTGVMNTGLVMEIKNGVPVSRTRIVLSCATKTILKAKLAALGDATTVRTSPVYMQKGIPWQELRQYVSAPAAFCRDVDVFSWNIRE